MLYSDPQSKESAVSTSEIFHRGIPLSRCVLLSLSLSRVLVGLKFPDIGVVSHDVFGNIVSLPLLEGGSQSLVAVILVVGLIFVVFHADKVAVNRVGVKRQRDEGVDGCHLGDDFEMPVLLPCQVSPALVGSKNLLLHAETG